MLPYKTIKVGEFIKMTNLKNVTGKIAQAVRWARRNNRYYEITQKDNDVTFKRLK